MTIVARRDTNWATNVSQIGAVLPGSVEELSELIAASGRVRVIGSGHSFSELAVVTGDLILLDRLPTAVTVHAAAGTVTLTGPVRYCDLVEPLNEAGLALPNLAALTQITVAGACSTGTHGSGDAQRCLADSVLAVQLIDADGQLQELSRETLGADFAGCAVSLGAIGAITGITLRTEPAYQITQNVFVEVPLDGIEAELDAVFAAAYSVSVFTNLHSGRAHVVLKQRDGWAGSGWRSGRPAERPIHPVPELPPVGCTVQLGVPGPWHTRLPHFLPGFLPEVGEELQSEFYVAREHARDAVRAVRALASQLAPVQQICELRTVRADELWLSPAYHQDSLTIHFTWRPDLAAVGPAIAAVEAALAPFGARPHWAKLTSRRPAELHATTPRLAAFRELATRLDPRAIFRNPFLDELLATGPDG